MNLHANVCAPDQRQRDAQKIATSANTRWHVEIRALESLNGSATPGRSRQQDLRLRSGLDADADQRQRDARKIATGHRATPGRSQKKKENHEPQPENKM
jgi:hypothetical protein